MGLFGRKKEKAEAEKLKAILAETPEAEAPKVILPGEAKMRNDEVTVQIERTRTCLVSTAMATHMGTREYQQDAAYVCEPLYDEGMAFAILCDGMGGMAEGERVSSDVVAFMANRIAALDDGQDIPAFLEKAAADANEMVLQSNAATGQDSGTTLITAIIKGGGLYWLSVGDSRIYIIRGGDIAQVTRDHNFALELQELVDAGRITREQADNDPRKDALVSYIGAPVLELADVNRSPFQLEYGDIVLLCSDGLTKALFEDQILAQVARHGSDMAEAARVLPLTAFDECPGGMDNTSVILMQFFGTAQ